MKNPIRPIYYKILRRYNCGPLDGGCLMYAVAYQNVYGGDLWGIRGYYMHAKNKKPLLQHIMVKKNNLFYDAEGAFTEQQLKKRWERLEHVHVDSVEPLPPMPAIKEIMHKLKMPYSEKMVTRMEKAMRNNE
jgi:hypothetical protein